jgi:hypothetical protein
MTADLKKKLNEWLNENINVPLAKRGHEDLGAGLSAVASAGGEMIIPDDASDLAMAALPGGRLASILKKMGKTHLDKDALAQAMKILQKEKAVKKKPQSQTLDYADIQKKEFKKAQQKHSQPQTLDYTKIAKEEADKAKKAKRDKGSKINYGNLVKSLKEEKIK